jgi:hypothetical protein
LTDTPSTTTAEQSESEMKVATGRIIQFPLARKVPPTEGAELPVAGAGSASIPLKGADPADTPSPRRTLLTSGAGDVPPRATAPTKPWERLSSIYRRRVEPKPVDVPEPAVEKPKQQIVPGLVENPSVGQLISWLLNLRRGGVGFIYWNAGKVSLDIAITRAAKLSESAILEVAGQRLLVVEPLQSPPVPRSTLTPRGEAMADDALKPGTGRFVPRGPGTNAGCE